MNANSSLAQAYSFYQQNLLTNAYNEIENVLANDPTNAEAHNLRGAILEGLGRRREALGAYEEALRLMPTYAGARDNAARLVKMVQPAIVRSADSYTPLRGAGRLATVLAWLTLISFSCGALATFGQAFQYGSPDFIDLLGPLLLFLVGGILFVLLFVVGQGVSLILAIAANSQATAEATQELLGRLAKSKTDPVQ